MFQIAISCSVLLCLAPRILKKFMSAFRFSSQDTRKTKLHSTCAKQKSSKILSTAHGHENCQKCWTHFFLYISLSKQHQLWTLCFPIQAHHTFLGRTFLFFCMGGSFRPSIGFHPQIQGTFNNEKFGPPDLGTWHCQQ